MRVICGVILFAALVVPGLASQTASQPYASALVQFEAGNYRLASETLTLAMKSSPDNAASEALLSRCFFAMNDWDSALLHARDAVNLDPSSTQAHVSLGEALGRKAEAARSFSLAVQARRQFEQAVALTPADVDARRDLMEFYLQAPWILGGSKAKAREQADAIARINPVQGSLARARCDETTGDNSAAQAEYRQVLELRPNHVGPYLDVASAAVASKNASQLTSAVDGAEKVSPADPRVAYYRGVAHIIENQRLPQAEHDLKAYAAHAPDRRDYPSHASALSWLGTLYERLGKPNLAMIEYESALQLDPNFSAARKALLRLESK